MQKTVVVEIRRLKEHTKYLKQYRVSKTYKAHDEKGEYKPGDIVTMVETRPISKDKRWRVIELVKRPTSSGEEETEVPVNAEANVAPEN